MNLIITFAVAGEYFAIDRTGIRAVITGVGKANAAYCLTKAIAESHPDLVINLGTAGTRHFEVGDIIVGTHFIDRDLAPLDIEGVTSELHTDCNACFPSVVDNKCIPNAFTINTGDDFVTSDDDFVGDVIDMEAFALAVVCKNENIPFVAVKYITDVIGRNSVKAWNDRLSDARIALSKYFDRHIAPYV